MTATSPTPMTGESKAADVASGLLAHLRGVLQQPDLAYAEPPTRVTGGFDTMIYGFRLRGAAEEWSDPLILRVFRQHDDPVRARWEGVVQTAVVQLGYPAPRILLTSTDREAVGGPFIIMARLPGRMMLEDVFNPSRLVLQLPHILTEGAREPPKCPIEIGRKSPKVADDIQNHPVWIVDWHRRSGHSPSLCPHDVASPPTQARIRLVGGSKVETPRGSTIAAPLTPSPPRRTIGAGWKGEAGAR